MNGMDALTPSPSDAGRHEAEVFARDLRGVMVSVPFHVSCSLLGQLRLSAVLVDQAVRLLETKIDATLARVMLRAMLTEAKPPGAGLNVEVPAPLPTLSRDRPAP